MPHPRGGVTTLRSVQRRAIVSFLLAPLVALAAACGESDSASKPPPKREPKPENRATDTPQQILAAASRDVAKVRGYHVEGTETDKDGVNKLSGDVSSEGKLRFAIEVGRSSITIIAIGKTTYLKADDDFWKSEAKASPELAATLAERWVKAPSSTANVLKGLVPKDLSYCLRQGTGSLRNAGVRRQGGRRAVVIADKGDKPGTAPSELYVAATGPALPLRVTQSGKEKPGGRPDPRCDNTEPGDEASTTTAADYRFTDYDKPVRITAPSGALDLDKLQRENNSTPA